jgi:hypothetical protein
MTQEEMIDEYFATEWAVYQPFPKQVVVEGHPSEDDSARWPVDRRLRAHGCKIERRWRTGEPVWSHPKHGQKTESAMLAALGIRPLKGGLGK